MRAPVRLLAFTLPKILPVGQFKLRNVGQILDICAFVSMRNRLTIQKQTVEGYR
jgi:hypothetical protein